MAGGLSFENDREGKSYFASSLNEKNEKKALSKLSSSDILKSFQSVLLTTSEEGLCSFEINSKFQSELTKKNPQFSAYAGALYHLRSLNQIDDAVFKNLLDAYEIQTARMKFSSTDDRDIFVIDSEALEKVFNLLQVFQKEGQSKKCFDEAYSELYSDISKIKKLSQADLQTVYLEANKRGVIDGALLAKLSLSAEKGIESQGNYLKKYYKTLSRLRGYYPLPSAQEKSDFVTKASNVKGMSRRQQLLRNFNEFQIITMGSIIKKLKARLESPKVEILVYDKTQVQEVVTLEPMERFRFAVKLLRKEMTMLQLNSTFEGRGASYLDLMTAAYEIGIIPASELDEVAGLEDIWNPKKTFWQKADIWVRSFSNMLSLVIPPPYGFIPTLALVVIEATVGKDTNKQDNSDDLF